MSTARRVWSSDHGRLCPACSRLIAACRCKKKAAPAGAAPADGIVRVSRSTKGRKGKGVTLITGVPLQGEALKACAKELKTACGAGGALKGDVIEIQGDHRDRLVPLLEAKGWSVKRAGG
jgi:translation initiation factor 1